jgi:hypothetical protein
VFDPAEWSSDKRYVCEDDDLNIDEQSPIKTTDKKAFPSTQNSNDIMHSTKMPNISEVRSYLTTIIILSIVFLVFIFIFIVLRKKIKKYVCGREDTSIDVHETTSNNSDLRSGSAKDRNIQNIHVQAVSNEITDSEL